MSNNENESYGGLCSKCLRKCGRNTARCASDACDSVCSKVTGFFSGLRPAANMRTIYERLTNDELEERPDVLMIRHRALLQPNEVINAAGLTAEQEVRWARRRAAQPRKRAGSLNNARILSDRQLLLTAAQLAHRGVGTFTNAQLQAERDRRNPGSATGAARGAAAAAAAQPQPQGFPGTSRFGPAGYYTGPMPGEGPGMGGPGMGGPGMGRFDSGGLGGFGSEGKHDEDDSSRFPSNGGPSSSSAARRAYSSNGGPSSASSSAAPSHGRSFGLPGAAAASLRRRKTASGSAASGSAAAGSGAPNPASMGMSREQRQAEANRRSSQATTARFDEIRRLAEERAEADRRAAEAARQAAEAARQAMANASPEQAVRIAGQQLADFLRNRLATLQSAAGRQRIRNDVARNPILTAAQINAATNTKIEAEIVEINALLEDLGDPPTLKSYEVARKWQLTVGHPDKGGDTEFFKKILAINFPRKKGGGKKKTRKAKRSAKKSLKRR